MFWQLLVVLMVTIAFAVLAVQALNGKHIGGVHPIVREQFAERFAAAFRVMTNCPVACSRDKLLRDLGGTDMQFTESSTLPALQGLHDMVLEKMLADNGVPHAQAVHHRDSRDAGESIYKLDIAAVLPNRHWLVAKTTPLVHTSWWHPAGETLVMILLPVMLIMLGFTRSIARRLNVIFEAARRLGYGMSATPLPVSGPKELRRVISSFNAMQERVLRLINNHTQTVAAISHDLRSPLAAARIRVELLEDERHKPALRSKLDEMGRMLGETLLHFRGDEQREALCPIDLVQVIRALCEEYDLLGQDVRIVAQPASLVLICKPVALKRALTNMLDNAIRYGQRARIRVETDSVQTCIQVEDDGPGIPADMLDQAFEPFCRLQPDVPGGVGLGLTIIRSCALAMGGQVTLNNQPEGGLCVSLTLPHDTN